MLNSSSACVPQPANVSQNGWPEMPDEYDDDAQALALPDAIELTRQPLVEVQGHGGFFVRSSGRDLRADAADADAADRRRSRVGTACLRGCAPRGDRGTR
jgi:hypothetical protein